MPVRIIRRAAAYKNKCAVKCAVSSYTRRIFVADHFHRDKATGAIVKVRSTQSCFGEVRFAHLIAFPSRLHLNRATVALVPPSPGLENCGVAVPQETPGLAHHFLR